MYKGYITMYHFFLLHILSIHPFNCHTVAILLYISEPGALKWINKPFPWQCLEERDEDTSWISLLFAYVSCRGIVQWFVNFWLIKDNYIDGLAAYRKLIFDKKNHFKILFYKLHPCLF